ncbi:MAG: hypothetical protein ACT4P3_01895 [Betaproteobacteria bacterium]
MLRAFAILSGVLFSCTAAAQDASALLARHAALQAQLADNPFGRPLHVESKTSGAEHRGEVYAVIEQPYSFVAPGLARAAHRCEILALQVNVKRCDASREALSAFITRKPRDAVESAYRVDFRYQVAAGADYLRVALAADAGPVGTRDYQIRLEAAPLGAERTFVHMSYAYTLGFMARIAMDAYLAGSGRDKVGFSIVERLPDGRPVYVDGVRGVIERSAMRYHLAIEAFLDSPQDLETRLRGWYAGTERHPQLAEPVGADEYLEMKRRQASRATSPQSRRRSGAASVRA